VRPTIPQRDPKIRKTEATIQETRRDTQSHRRPRRACIDRKRNEPHKIQNRIIRSGFDAKLRKTKSTTGIQDCTRDTNAISKTSIHFARPVNGRRGPQAVRLHPVEWGVRSPRWGFLSLFFLLSLLYRPEAGSVRRTSIPQTSLEVLLATENAQQFLSQFTCCLV